MELDEGYLNRVHVVCVADGYGPLIEKNFLPRYAQANIHDIRKLDGKYWTKELSAGNDDVQDKFFKLNFINRLNMTNAFHEDKKDDDKSSLKKSNIRATEVRTTVHGQEKRGRMRHIRAYGTNNIGHCFSRVMEFNEWMDMLTPHEKGSHFTLKKCFINNILPMFRNYQYRQLLNI